MSRGIPGFFKKHLAVKEMEAPSGMSRAHIRVYGSEGIRCPVPFSFTTGRQKRTDPRSVLFFMLLRRLVKAAGGLIQALEVVHIHAAVAVHIGQGTEDALPPGQCMVPMETLVGHSLGLMGKCWYVKSTALPLPFRSPD